jgi:hypothetical protein
VSLRFCGAWKEQGSKKKQEVYAMTRDLHSNENPDDDDDVVLDPEPKCPECGGELKYFQYASWLTASIKRRRPKFLVDVCCVACEYVRGIVATVVNDWD